MGRVRPTELTLKTRSQCIAAQAQHWPKAGDPVPEAEGAVNTLTETWALSQTLHPFNNPCQGLGDSVKGYNLALHFTPCSEPETHPPNQISVSYVLGLPTVGQRLGFLF